ncbi:MAG: hypothetical protein ABR536_01595 [Solirubrobacterales bacterium]
MSYPVDNALYEWEDGYSRLQALADEPGLYHGVHAAIEAVRDELRRRVGATFTVAELADLYGRGTDWCLEVATAVAPEQAMEWDPQVITDAAFHLQLRAARDWAGGKRLAID